MTEKWKKRPTAVNTFINDRPLVSLWYIILWKWSVINMNVYTAVYEGVHYIFFYLIH